jgi:predicted LPLAT superfamily acyltransferase
MKYLILSLGLLVANTALADEVSDRRLRMLMFQHHGPPAAEVFEAHVPDAKARLLAWASDAAANRALRDRALLSLGAFGGEDVQVIFDRVLADPMAAKTTRAYVLTAYARAFKEKAIPVLEQEVELKHIADEQLRLLRR